MFTYNKTKTAQGTLFTASCNGVVYTKGDSLWASGYGERRVRVQRLEIEVYDDDGSDGLLCSDLRVYFNTQDWDTANGLLYTDSGVDMCVRVLVDMLLQQMHAENAGTVGTIAAGSVADCVEYIGWSEQGMQGDDYCSFDAYELAELLQCSYI